MGSSKSEVRDSRSRRVVAVEIGARQIEAMEVEIRGADARILRYGAAPVSETAWDDLRGQRESIVQALRAAMSSSGIKSARVVTCVPRRFVTIKYARLPQGSPEQVGGMVRFEAQQYIPFPIEEVVLDHQIVSEATDDMATVVIAAARSSLINDLLAIFDKAGLDVSRVSVTSLALAEHLRDETMPTAICRQAGGQLDIAVAGAGRVLFSRSAEVMPDDSEAAPGDALIGELARSLASFQNEHRAQPVGKLVVAQATSPATDQMTDAIAAALQMDVVHLSLPGVDGGPANGAGVVALGLAYHESAVAISSVNLVPAERVARQAEARRRTIARLTAVAAVAALVVVAWMGQRALASHARERRLAVTANSRLKRLEPTVKKAQADAEALQRTFMTVNHGLGRDKPVVDVLKVVSDALPKAGGLQLTQLTFDRNGPVVLHGTAEKQVTVTEFLVGLQTAGIFAEARLGYLGDAKAGLGPRGSANGAATSGADEQASMSFMVYCRLPQPVSADEEKRATRGRPGSSLVAREANQ